MKADYQQQRGESSRWVRISAYDGAPYPGDVAGFARDPEHGGNCPNPGIGMRITVEALRDTPGLPFGGQFVDLRLRKPRQNLGRGILVRLGLGRSLDRSFPPTARADFVHHAPVGWPIPPAWGIWVTPDETLATGNRPRGNF